MVNKKIFVSILAVGAMTMAVLSAGSVYAQTPGNTLPKNPFANFIELIIQKFGLDRNQVQTVVNQYKADKQKQMQDDRQEREQDRLTKLVQAGKITEAQKKAILTELSALRAKYDRANMKSLSQTDRQKQFQAEQDEIKSWTQSQGVDPTYVMPGFGMQQGKGWGFRHE